MSHPQMAEKKGLLLWFIPCEYWEDHYDSIVDITGFNFCIYGF